MSVPAIDYTDKDFASLRAAMLRLATQRLGMESWGAPRPIAS